MKAKHRLLTFAAAVAFVIFPMTVFAQEFPKYEFAGGFTFLGMEEKEWYGWNISGVKNFNHYFGIAVEIDGAYSSKTIEFYPIKYITDHRRYFFLAGPKFTKRDMGNWIPYFTLLAGAEKTSISWGFSGWEGGEIVAGSDNTKAFAIRFGGGIDYAIKDSLAIRLVQADMLNNYGDRGWRMGGMVSFGLVLRLGKGED